MSEIDRFDMTYAHMPHYKESLWMEPCRSGEFVRFTDHERVVAEQSADIACKGRKIARLDGVVAEQDARIEELEGRVGVLLDMCRMADGLEIEAIYVVEIRSAPAVTTNGGGKSNG